MAAIYTYTHTNSKPKTHHVYRFSIKTTWWSFVIWVALNLLFLWFADSTRGFYTIHNTYDSTTFTCRTRRKTIYCILRYVLKRRMLLHTIRERGKDCKFCVSRVWVKFIFDSQHMHKYTTVCVSLWMPKWQPSLYKVDIRTLSHIIGRQPIDR